MKVIDKSITAWQTGILLFILLFANKILVLPSLMYDGASFESFLIPVVLFVFEMGLLYLFYKLKTKFPEESFAEILKNRIGKIPMLILYLCFMIFFLGKAVLLYNVTYIFFRNMIYKDSSNFVFLFSLLPIINYMAIVGLRSIGRTAQLFFPGIVLITMFCIVIGFFGINSTPLIFESSFSQFALTTLKHISPFGDTLFLFLIMDKIKIKKGEWKVIFSLAGVACFLVVGITLVFVLSYTYTSFMHPFAIFEIMSYVKDYGGLGRIDIISMSVIIVYTYFHLTIYLKTFMLAFHEVLPKLNAIYSVLTFNLLFLIIIDFLIINLEVAVTFGERILPYFEIVPFLLVPIVVVIVLSWKRKQDKGVT